MENEKAFLVRLGFVTSTSTECSGSWINDENKENDDPQKSTKTPKLTSLHPGQKNSEWTALERNKENIAPPPVALKKNRVGISSQVLQKKKRLDKKTRKILE
mmetsp:Transcript_13019/g.15880  ORF Transcript_13019/g.15880 Transcript_13019/m.15880 type:complete len:102 (-) Transcript_13019:377-682(-)